MAFDGYHSFVLAIDLDWSDSLTPILCHRPILDVSLHPLLDTCYRGASQAADEAISLYDRGLAHL